MPGPLVKEGDRVTLRVLERDDFDFWQQSYATPEIRHPTGNPQVRTLDDVEDTYEDENSTVFVVCLDDDREPGTVSADDVRRIGTVSIAEFGRNPRIGYWLVPEVHGEGYGSEAVSLLVEYVFRCYDTRTVRAKVFDFNTASQQLLESLGFTREGELRKEAFLDGGVRNAYIYGLLREEWEADQSTDGV